MIAILAVSHPAAIHALRGLGTVVEFNRPQGSGKMRTDRGIEGFRIVTRTEVLKGMEIDHYMVLGASVSAELLRTAEMQVRT